MKRIINVLKKWLNIFPSFSKAFSVVTIASVSLAEYLKYLRSGTDA